VLLGIDVSRMFDWATKASGSGSYCERMQIMRLGGVKSSDCLQQAPAFLQMSLSHRQRKLKDKNQKIIPPVPQVDPSAPDLRFPPDTMLRKEKVPAERARELSHGINFDWYPLVLLWGYWGRRRNSVEILFGLLRHFRRGPNARQRRALLR
jgi:hypothetical protein